MQDWIIIGILAIAIAAGVRESVRHFKGEGGCCGGASSRPKKKKLKNKVIRTYSLKIEGMRCRNCGNIITEIINDFDGAAGRVDWKKKTATILCDKEIDVEQIKEKIRRRGYKVL